MLKYIDYLRGVTRHPINVEESNIAVEPGFYNRLRQELDPGDHIYLTVMYGRRFEIVKYIHSEERPLECRGSYDIPVERDQLNRGKKNFPCGSKIFADFNSIQLREFVAQG